MSSSRDIRPSRFLTRLIWTWPNSTSAISALITHPTSMPSNGFCAKSGRRSWPHALQQPVCWPAQFAIRSGLPIRTQPGIELQANVSDPDGLYQSFRVAINPVRFGTGLKIKNQEALAAGKPLVVSANGAEGMATADGSGPWQVFSTA